MEKSKLRHLAFYFLGFIMALTSCGGGGGGGDSPTKYRLDVKKTGLGTVTTPGGECDPSCTGVVANLNAGTQVTLTATAAAGYNFSSWVGCDSASGSSCVVTMNQNKTVTANFVDNPTISNLTYSPPSAILNSGGGTVTVNGSFDFVDGAGNLSALTMSVFNSAGDQVSTNTNPINGAEGVKAGRIYGSFIVSTTTLGDFLFQVYVADATGLKSNTLTGSFSITEGPVQNPPSISNLSYSPTSAYMNSGGGTVTVNFSVGFFDEGGNLSTYTVTVFDSTSIQVSTSTTPIQGVSGVKNGVINSSFLVPTTALGSFTFQIYVTDAAGIKSNMLAGGLSITEPPAQNPPSISNFRYSPTYANWNSGGGNVTVSCTVDFTDAGGNLSTMTLTVFDIAANQVSTGTVPISGGTSGSVTGNFSVPTTTVGNFSLQVYVTDVDGLKSNILTGSFSVKDVWITKAPVPTARYYLAAGVVNGKFYAIGGAAGVTGGIIPVNKMEEYDPTTDTWTTKAPMPTARLGLCAAAVNAKILTFGGDGGTRNEVQEYDPVTDTWATKTPMPTARFFSAASAINGKIYVIGGATEINVPIGTVEEYDPATNIWATKTPMPTPRYDLAATVVNGKIYAIGGEGTTQSGYKVEEYDPVTDTWATKTPMPTPRSGLAASAVNGKIYAIGGTEGGGGMNKMEEYDPATDTWATKTPMPTARYYFAADTVNGKIYAIGGYEVGFGITNKVEEYDPAKDF